MRPIATHVARSVVCVLRTNVSPAKKDEPMEMPFGLYTRRRISCRPVSVCLSVCLYMRLSQAGVVSKRMNYSTAFSLFWQIIKLRFEINKLQKFDEFSCVTPLLSHIRITSFSQFNNGFVLQCSEIDGMRSCQRRTRCV